MAAMKGWDESLEQAAEALQGAEALLIGAGAGMGVDSGLPDFRGDRGFWRAYPPFEALGLRFVDLANPRWFDDDPRLAWGFYGHRLHLYRDTAPHEGFAVLRRLGADLPQGAFVFTSNVDGQFQRAGFDEEAALVECHGSIHHLQCARPCHDEVWAADEVEVEVDPESFRATGPLPTCPRCGGLARPNILMFGDGRWLESRAERQAQRMQRWLEGLKPGALAVVECGAGTAVPTVRMTCERLARGRRAPLVRINPREAHGPQGTISVAGPAAEALSQIEALLL